MSDVEVPMEKKVSAAAFQSHPTKSRGAASVLNPNLSAHPAASINSLSAQQVLHQNAGESWRSGSKSGRNEKPKNFAAAQKRSSAPLHKAKAASDKRFLPHNIDGRFRNQVGSNDAELGSLSRPGSKKGGLKSVLSENFDIRNQKRRDQWFAGRQRAISASGGDYNKERYLQANCQFVVCDAFDYSLNLLDPDLLVDWEQIEELRMISDEIPNCPICLYPPVAAKITRCGHVFCWSCILHYLALSDREWRKCPICFESVYGKQLKSVMAVLVDKVRVDATITMRLMRRNRTSTIALPVADWKNHQQNHLVMEDECSRYSKLLKVGHQAVCDTIIKRERRELEAQLATDKDQPEACFILQALNALEEREESIQKAIELKEVASSPSLVRSLSPDLVLARRFSPEQGVIGVFVDAFENVEMQGAVGRDQPVFQVEDVEYDGESMENYCGKIESGRTTSISSTEEQCLREMDSLKNSVYFYQADDGQQVYMSPFNVKCLVHQYGSLENAPEVLSGKVLQLDSYVMTENTRHRFRYISHLPLSTCFALAELRFDRGVLSKETVACFSEEFSRRNQARSRRDREDKRRAIKAERWDRACLMDPTNYPLARNSSCPVPDIPVITYVASAEQDIKANLETASPTQSDQNWPRTDGEASSAAQENSDSQDSHQTDAPPSFAQMLKSGKPKPAVQVKWTSAAEAVPGPSTCTGAQEENGHAPAYQNTFGDVLQAAFDNMKLDEQQATGKSKKKKKKSKLLLAIG